MLETIVTLVLCQWIYGIRAIDITSVCAAICPFSIFPALHRKEHCAITGNGKWLLYHFFNFIFGKDVKLEVSSPLPKMCSVIENLPCSCVHTRTLGLLIFKARTDSVHPLLLAELHTTGSSPRNHLPLKNNHLIASSTRNLFPPVCYSPSDCWNRT